MLAVISFRHFLLIFSLKMASFYQNFAMLSDLLWFETPRVGTSFLPSQLFQLIVIQIFIKIMAENNNIASFLIGLILT